MKKLLIILPIIFLIGCSFTNKSDKNTIPDKHKNIPEGAFWQGGVDGGAWYLCTTTKKEFQHHCSVYNDFTGEIIIEDDFDLYISINQKDILMRDYLSMDKLTEDKVNAFGNDIIYLQGTLLLKPSV